MRALAKHAFTFIHFFSEQNLAEASGWLAGCTAVLEILQEFASLAKLYSVSDSSSTLDFALINPRKQMITVVKSTER